MLFTQLTTSKTRKANLLSQSSPLSWVWLSKQFHESVFSGCAEELVWFENGCLGVNKLGSMMKELSKAANLSQGYTNHCIRATAITLWLDAVLLNAT